MSPLSLAEKAVRLNGSVGRYHRQLAEVQGVMAQHAGVFQQIGFARRFRKEIDVALALDPNDVQALRDLLEFHLLAPGVVGGDGKKAEAVAQRIAAIDACEGFLASARMANFRKDQKETEAMLRRAVSVKPSSYKALMALAAFQLASGRDDREAESLAQAAIKVDSGRAEAYGILATIYASRANWSALDALLPSAMQAVPDDLTPYYRAAERILSDGRDPARAEGYLRVYLAQEPEGNEPTAADAHWKLGVALNAHGQAANAVAEWKAAVKLDPESPARRELKRMKEAN